METSCMQLCFCHGSLSEFGDVKVEVCEEDRRDSGEVLLLQG